MKLALKIAWRNLFKHRGKSFVIGIILFLVIEREALASIIAYFLVAILPIVCLSDCQIASIPFGLTTAPIVTGKQIGRAHV